MTRALKAKKKTSNEIYLFIIFGHNYSKVYLMRIKEKVQLIVKVKTKCIKKIIEPIIPQKGPKTDFTHSL